jgi:hypothetical protein
MAGVMHSSRGTSNPFSIRYILTRRQFGAKSHSYSFIDDAPCSRFVRAPMVAGSRAVAAVAAYWILMRCATQIPYSENRMTELR